MQRHQIGTYFRNTKVILFTSIALLLVACKKESEAEPPVQNNTSIDYRSEMRNFVISIATSARSLDPNFIIIPQNGQELCSLNGLPNGPLATTYLEAINGQGREELYFGYDNLDDVATPNEDTEYWKAYLDRMQQAGITILVTDYCSSASNVTTSITNNEEAGYLSFAANSRELNLIPSFPTSPFGVNNLNITNLTEAQNFLYLINPDQFTTKAALLSAISETNYDVIIMDAFFDNQLLSVSEIEAIRHKANGGQRLLIAYMSIGEAEDYRYYWNSSWTETEPIWLGATNPDWPGNYKVEYWNSEWQSIIYGNEFSYTNMIISSGFDGAYLDLIDAFEYYEE